MADLSKKLSISFEQLRAVPFLSNPFRIEKEQFSFFEELLLSISDSSFWDSSDEIYSGSLRESISDDAGLLEQEQINAPTIKTDTIVCKNPIFFI